MIAHIVLFRPKPDMTPDQRESFALVFQHACRNIPSLGRVRVGRIEAGESTEVPKLGRTTYQYAAVLEFDDRDGLEKYLKDPAHEELARLFWQHCESTLIVDADVHDPMTESTSAILGSLT